MPKSIVVIDYGMGNLRSVSKAIEHVAGQQHRVHVTDQPRIIREADRVVFPGQGAARDCMAALSEHHLNEAVLVAAREKPFLGICMGLQVLMESSEENGGTELLGMIPGRVKRFPPNMLQGGRRLKIPQMGWNQVYQVREHPLWAGIPQDTRFYFVHSYYVDPGDTRIIAGTTGFGIDFTSVIATENLFATQFHPEKSAGAGLQLLSNFINWSP
ncbi:MAG: imidazole glycerol phosphate synthase subunit HisH [Gammaproteobacteria bacterium]|nr:imidazole glycerol phosphate synthase subunit HisH [Gammaproteobacteria bacterium]